MLTPLEGRVLGCLIEKERTVPDQYPLTMNALLTACNQSTSRDPVLRVAEHEVLAALTAMKGDGYVRLVHPSHGRSATRYRHIADERLGVDAAAAAVVAVLLLRGPQTAAELRARAERQHPFRTVDEVDEVLRGLEQRGLARLLERTPGRKEARWQQLVAREHGTSALPEDEHATRIAHVAAPPAPEAAVEGSAAGDRAGAGVPADHEASTARSTDAEELVRRVLELEDRVARLESALRDLL